MRIGKHETDDSTLVIAEIGNNHEGDVELAKRMIGLAAEAGADAVKFQTIIPEELVGPDQGARLAKLRRFQFSIAQFVELSACARESGCLFMTSPFALQVVEPLTPHVDAFKIASGDNNFEPLLRKVGMSGKPVVVSTGLLKLVEIIQLADELDNLISDQRLALLHCICAYPVPPAEADVLTVRRMAAALRCTVGYSDHTIGEEAVVLAVAAGARIVEKHFTIDKHYSDFRDHQLSADPDDMARLVARIRAAEELLGRGRGELASTEKGMLEPVRRSIVVKHSLASGHRVSWEDLAWHRPGTGLSPGRESEVIGKSLLRELSAGEQLLPEVLA